MAINFMKVTDPKQTTVNGKDVEVRTMFLEKDVEGLHILEVKWLEGGEKQYDLYLICGGPDSDSAEVITQESCSLASRGRTLARLIEEAEEEIQDRVKH